MWRAKRPTLLLYELSWQEELTSTHTPTYVQVPLANLCPSLPSVTRVAAAVVQDGGSALISAVAGFRHGAAAVQCCRVLIEAGINVDHQKESGDSALHLAAWFDQPALVEVLVNVGSANPDIKKPVRRSLDSTAPC